MKVLFSLPFILFGWLLAAVVFVILCPFMVACYGAAAVLQVIRVSQSRRLFAAVPPSWRRPPENPSQIPEADGEKPGSPDPVQVGGQQTTIEEIRRSIRILEEMIAPAEKAESKPDEAGLPV